LLEGGQEHARTLAGVAQAGRVLILVVADGYNPGTAIGLNPGDSALVLQAAGAEDGLFLDGGGSSTLVGRDADGTAVVLNRPAGLLNIPGTLRYVGVNLGFTGLRRTDEPLPALPDWEAPAWQLVWAKTITWTRVYPWRTGLILAAAGALLVGTIWLWRRRRRARRGRSAAAPPA
jgi:hypothetical protein